MTILVTGANGKLGALVAEALLDKVPASKLAVSVRDPGKAEALSARGVDVRYGDFDKPDSLDAAFAGIDRLLIVSTDGDNETRIRQHKNAVNAAVRAGVGFIAYTSLAKATDSTIFLAPVHQATEAAILATGIPYAFLRNNWYLENEFGTVQAVLAGAPWLTSAGPGKVGWAVRADYAEAAANVLAGDGHDNAVYELSGKPRTQEELAAILAGVLGREVPVAQVDDGAYEAAMKEAGVPEFALPFVVGIQQGIRAGAVDVASDDLERLLGRPATPLEEALRQFVGAVQA